MLFPDEDVYNQVVVPLSERREFNAFVVKLLTEYHYNGEIRALIDGERYNEDETPVMQEPTYNDAYAGIRESLAVIDVLLADGMNIISDEAKVFEDVVNEAKNKGVVREEDIGNGYVVQSLNLEKKDEPLQPSDNSQPSSDIGVVLKKIEDLYNMVTNISDDVNKLKRSINQVEDSDVSETQKLEESVIEPSINDNNEDDFDFSVGDNDDIEFIPEENEETAEEVDFDIDKVEHSVGEAYDAMHDLFSSM